MNLHESGGKTSARDSKTLELGSCWPSARAGTFCHAVLLQGLKALSSPEVETAQVGDDNQEDNLEGYLQAP